MTILFDLLLRIARGVSEDVIESLATGGSTTTLADTNGATLEADDFWNGGTLFFKSGRFINRALLISDFTKSTGTFTFPTPNKVSNPGFETDLTGYTAQAATLTRVTSAGYMQHGLAAMRIDPNTGASAGAYISLALTLNQPYCFSADVLDVAGQSFSLVITDSTGVTTLASTNWTGAGAWARRSVLYTPTATATYRAYLVRSAVASTTQFYTDGWQILEGTGATYLEALTGDGYLALTKAFPRSKLVQALGNALSLQTLVGEDTTTTVVSGQMEYDLPSGVSDLIRVDSGSDDDGWEQNFTWREEGGHLRFYAHEPASGSVRLYYRTKPAVISADSDAIDAQVDDDLAVFDALTSLWFHRARRAGKGSPEEKTLQFYQGEAERLRARHPAPNPAPRYSGL